MKVDGIAKTLPVAIATCLRFDLLDFGVDAFGAGVGGLERDGIENAP